MWAWINLLLSNLVVSSISKNVLGLGVETESALFLQPGRETKQLVKFLFTRMEDEILDLRCGMFGFCLLSFPQNKRKVYKLRQLNLPQFLYFSLVLREPEETKTKHSTP